MTSKKEEYIDNADSAGLILDFLSSSNNAMETSKFGRTSTFSTKKALEIIKNDPVVKGALKTLVDKITETGWRITGKKDAKVLEKLLKEKRFDRLLRQLTFNLLLYNNSFTEIVGKGKDVDLNLLETNLMEVEASDNGDIKGYFQEPNRKEHSWKESEVSFITIDKITTNIWADLDIEAMYDTILIKDYARQWLKWFFSTNQLRPILNLKGASTARIKDFISFFKAAERQLNKPLLIDGDFSIHKLQSFADEGKSVLDLIDKCDQQIAVLLQTPLIALGISDGSGRSDAVELKAFLNTRVRAIHKTLEEAFTYDLFPKMGFKDLEFRFGVIDESAAQKIFENVLTMRQAQFTEEAISEYLEAKGIFFDTKKVLKNPEELAMMSNKELGTGNEGLKGNASADSAKSRQRKGVDAVSKANSKEMVSNAFDNYPYTYEVISDDK